MEKVYLNTTLTPEARAEALLREMTLEEKLAQVQCIFPFFSGWDDYEKIARDTPYGIGQISTLQMRDMATKEECCAWQRRLQSIVMENSPHHIPAVFHMEGLCGAFIQDSTSFPSGIARGAGWDPELETAIGKIVSRQEAACGITQVLAPVLDIGRDPRMGRHAEPYGEDATLVAAMGTAYLKGLQEAETAGRKTEGTAKHFLAFHNSQGGIHGTHSDTPSRLLREVYAKPFQAAITEGGLQGIMPSYNSLNGEPISASRHILTGLLREEMGFQGQCISDYGAVRNAHNVQHIGETLAETGHKCMAAGMDVELPSVDGFSDELLEQFTQDPEILDRAVLRVLTSKFRMGLFENPYALDGEELEKAMLCPEDREITLQAARQSLVLLKNDGILPLKGSIKTIAVIGPHAGFANKFFGGYTHMAMAESTYAVRSSIAGVDGVAGAIPGVEFIPGTKVQSDETPQIQAVLQRQKPECRSLLEQLRKELPEAEILCAYGYPVAGEDNSHYEEALALIAKADLAILTLGGKHGTCSISTMGEGVDATSINLPPCQEAFLLRAAKLGVPMVGVHLDGRPISSNAADKYLNAILECWSPAETGAQAIAEVLLGKHSPSGKLPVSVAYNAGQVSVFYSLPYGSGWSQSESIGFPDYVDCPHTPRYPFGFGLSYTSFRYNHLELSKSEVNAGDSLEIRFTVENTGSVPGDEVVQLYLRDEFASMVRPVKELAGFLRVPLAPGQRKQVTFPLDTSILAFLDESMRWKIEHGNILVEVGASSQDIRLEDSFRILGDKFIDGKTRAFWADGNAGE